MPAASLAPHVRILIVCDEGIASDTESGVFTLEGVRQHVFAGSFPWSVRLDLFLLVSSARKGTYPGKVLIINERLDRTIRYIRFAAAFQDDHEVLPLCVELGECEFPEPGRYTFQIWFISKNGQDVEKGELPFSILQPEE
jgi:hypothetical protein